VWSDLFLFEVVDEATGETVPDGEVGTLAMTALYNNNVTPFLRWNSGDLVSLNRDAAADGGAPWSIFPVMRHARRTVGFFKVRGVNINHNELEDLMFYNASVQDFKAEVVSTDSGLDLLRLLVEPRRGLSAAEIGRDLGASVQKTFEVTPEIVFLESGTLGKEFEASIKAARFVDKRG
jgi:phenylacetate-CoA ligase